MSTGSLSYPWELSQLSHSLWPLLRSFSLNLYKFCARLLSSSLASSPTFSSTILSSTLWRFTSSATTMTWAGAREEATSSRALQLASRTAGSTSWCSCSGSLLTGRWCTCSSSSLTNSGSSTSSSSSWWSRQAHAVLSALSFSGSGSGDVIIKYMAAIQNYRNSRSLLDNTRSICCVVSKSNSP